MELSEEAKNELVSKDIVSFFDLLAKFDYEDKQKEKSVLKTDLVVSAPMGSVLDSDTKKIYGAENKTIKG